MKKILYWLPPLLWMSVIYYFSGRTGSQLNSLFPFIKNFDWGHVTAYLILSALFYYAFARTTSLKHISLWSVLLCLTYAVSDEYHQSFVPSRSAEILDIRNDMIGAMLAVVAINLFKKIRNTNRKTGNVYK